MHKQLPDHVRATYTFYMIGNGNVEVAASVKNLTHSLGFADDASAPAFMRAMGMSDHLADDFRFMTAAETADYLARHDADEMEAE